MNYSLIFSNKMATNKLQKPFLKWVGGKTQIIESILETHVDWTRLTSTDENFKHQLQIKCQRKFKTTPNYLEIEKNLETGYKMGVYLCIGQQIFNLKHSDSTNISKFKTFKSIQDYITQNEKASQRFSMF